MQEQDFRWALGIYGCGFSNVDLGLLPVNFSGGKTEKLFFLLNPRNSQDKPVKFLLTYFYAVAPRNKKR